MVGFRQKLKPPSERICEPNAGIHRKLDAIIATAVASLALTFALGVSPAAAQQGSDRDARIDADRSDRVEVAAAADTEANQDGAITGEGDQGTNFARPRLDLGYKSERWGRFFGEAAMTEPPTAEPGAADANGLVDSTVDPAGGTGVGQLYVGWSSDRLLGDAGNTVTLSVGRQDIRVGESLVVWDPQYDAAAADTVPTEDALFRTAILSVAAGPAQGGIFYLRGEGNSDRADVTGLNLTVSEDGLGTLDGGYYKIVDASDRITRGEANVMMLRASDIGPPVLSRFDVQGEYVDDPVGTSTRFGNPTSFVEAGYRLRNGLPWAARVAYRYSFATGSDVDDVPLFDATRGWGPWQSHQAVGACLLLDRHDQAHSLHLSMQPAEGIDVGALYHSLLPVAEGYQGDPLSSAHSVDAFGLYADWMLGDRFSLGVAGGLAMPRDRVGGSARGRDKPPDPHRSERAPVVLTAGGVDRHTGLLAPS